jgi:hypothetical protein
LKLLDLKPQARVLEFQFGNAPVRGSVYDA